MLGDDRILDVAGVTVALRCARDDEPLLEQRYASFLRPRRPGDRPFTLRLELRELGPNWPDPLPAFALRPGDGPVVLEGGGARAELDFARGSGTLRAPRSERPVDAVLKLVLATCLIDAGGLLAHASAVLRDDHAWIFSGPSGAGKSTIAAELPGRLLCDEAVALHPDGLSAAATPYWRAQPGAAPIAALLFLARGPRPGWRRLPPAKAAARLVSESGPTLPDRRAAALDAAARLTAALPCVELTLSRIADIRSWLDPRLRLPLPSVIE